MKNDNEIEFNSDLWAGIYILLNNQDCLSTEGKIVWEMMQMKAEGKKYDCLTTFRYKYGLSSTEARNIIRKFCNKNQLCLIKNGREKVVVFTEEVKSRGLEFPLLSLR